MVTHPPALRSAIEALRAETLAEVPDARIGEDFAELYRVGELLEMERLRRLAELERRRSFERDGLDAESRSDRGEDDRTPAQRRADALGEICRRWLDGTDRPTVAGERPHVTVTVDVDALRDGAAGRSEADHVGPVHPQTVRRLACDASIRRVVMAGPSEPLDVGRRTPVVPPGLRRAVILRDGHCRFPGCDRPHQWCDVHHVVHWADGGPTALQNLALLCRRHHGMVHPPGGVRLELSDGRPVFRRPDGSVLEERTPP